MLSSKLIGSFFFGLALIQLEAQAVRTSTSEKTLKRVQALRTVKVVEHLVANANTRVTTVAFKSEAEGISDIRQLIETSPREEMWAFIPGENAWYEIGITEIADRAHKDKNGKLDGFVTSASVDWELLDVIEKSHENLKLYHFHPRAGTATLAALAESAQTDDARLFAGIQDQRDALPSPLDLVLMIEESTYFQGFVLGARSMTWVICSALGTTEFSLRIDGLRRFDKAKDDVVQKFAFQVNDDAQKAYLDHRRARKFDRGQEAFIPVVEAQYYLWKYNRPELYARFRPY